MRFQINEIIRVGKDYGRICAFTKDCKEDDDVMYNIWWFNNTKTSWIKATEISNVDKSEEKQCVIYRDI